MGVWMVVLMVEKRVAWTVGLMVARKVVLMVERLVGVMVGLWVVGMAA
jgi:hypothetical protein